MVIYPTTSLQWHIVSLGQVNKYEYLGITIQDNLVIDGHLKKLIPNVYNKIYMLCKLKKYIDSRTAVLIFKTYVLPRVVNMVIPLSLV